MGDLIMVSNDTHLVGLWFSDQKYVGGSLTLDSIKVQLSDINERVVQWLNLYFAGNKPDPRIIPVDPQVTNFRKSVLGELSNTPYGTIRTYQSLYEGINVESNKKIGSARAVGGAVGHNPISIIIPCHRVVGSDGSLTGYAGGLERKKRLLQLEGVQI
jgi:methylated-DNA-[protein]-cysteine S-methyltransferase